MGLAYAVRRIKRRSQSAELKLLQDADYSEEPIVNELLRAPLSLESEHDFVPFHVQLLWRMRVMPVIDVTFSDDREHEDKSMCLLYGYLTARRIMGHEIRHRPDDDLDLLEPMSEIYQDWVRADMIGSQGSTAVESAARLAQALQSGGGLAKPQLFVPITCAQILAAAEAVARRPRTNR